jgi:hypothetical protein
MDNFKNYAESGYIFLLPMATIIETGNHIAHNGNGDVRRQTAERFVKEVKAALMRKLLGYSVNFLGKKISCYG